MYETDFVSCDRAIGATHACPKDLVHFQQKCPWVLCPKMRESALPGSIQFAKIL